MPRTGRPRKKQPEGKVCRVCKRYKLLPLFTAVYTNTRADGSRRTYFKPDCKPCTASKVRRQRRLARA